MSMPLRPGDPTRLGAYELVGRLGQGGMGTVFAARAADGTPVAIKMVRPEFSGDEEFRARFRSEVRRAQQVPPFSTAAVLDADPEHDPPYLVVEFVDGPSLSAMVQDRGPLSGPALHGVAVGIATALTAIHGTGVIHRDLKPGNVLFALGGIKVIDFGIARAFEATSRHTRTDQMVGTVAYMAPERFEPEFGAEVSAAADIFAWGAVVTYAATGRTPFAADSPAATAVRILTREPDIAGVPEPLRGLVQWSLAKYPAQRPTARQLLDALLDSATTPMRAAPAAIPPRDDTVPVNQAGPPGRAVENGQPGDVARPGRLRRFALASGAAVLLAAGGLLASHEFFSGEPLSSVTASSPAQPEPVDAVTGIMAGDRRFSMELENGGRFFMMDRSDQELDVSDGTGSQSQFVLQPVGVNYLIRSLTNEGYTGPDICLGVKILPDEGAAPMVGTACNPTKGTLFTVVDSGEKDSKGRVTYRIGNEYGWLLWDAGKKRSEVTQVGEARWADAYTFLDRGDYEPADSPSTAPSAAPSAAPATSGPKLVAADISQLKYYDLDIGVPVVITSPPDGGDLRNLEAQPDGTLAFTGTATTESSRLRIEAAKVRKHTEANQNTVTIVAAPAVAVPGTPSCVTDVTETVLRMQPCVAGSAAQSWKLVPQGDSGVFELRGAHTAIRVGDDYKIVTQGGRSTLQTIAVK